MEKTLVLLLTLSFSLTSNAREIYQVSVPSKLHGSFATTSVVLEERSISIELENSAGSSCSFEGISTTASEREIASTFAPSLESKGKGHNCRVSIIKRNGKVSFRDNKKCSDFCKRGAKLNAQNLSKI